jgi:hypothetical protein
MNVRLRRQNPITKLGPQTLACHVAFWKRIVLPERRSERLGAINKLLESIHEKYDDEFTQGFDEKKTFDTFEMLWHSIPVTLHFMLHEELISYIIYIHVDRVKDSGAGVVGKLKKYFADITTPAVVDCADLPTRHKFLFRGDMDQFFWRE